jgi:hypothetical protein
MMHVQEVKKLGPPASTRPVVPLKPRRCKQLSCLQIQRHGSEFYSPFFSSFFLFSQLLGLSYEAQLHAPRLWKLIELASYYLPSFFTPKQKLSQFVRMIFFKLAELIIS